MLNLFAKTESCTLKTEEKLKKSKTLREQAIEEKNNIG